MRVGAKSSSKASARFISSSPRRASRTAASIAAALAAALAPSASLLGAGANPYTGGGTGTPAAPVTGNFSTGFPTCSCPARTTATAGS